MTEVLVCDDCSRPIVQRYEAAEVFIHQNHQDALNCRTVSVKPRLVLPLECSHCRRPIEPIQVPLDSGRYRHSKYDHYLLCANNAEPRRLTWTEHLTQKSVFGMDELCAVCNQRYGQHRSAGDLCPGEQSGQWRETAFTPKSPEEPPALKKPAVGVCEFCDKPVIEWSSSTGYMHQYASHFKECRHFAVLKKEPEPLLCGICHREMMPDKNFINGYVHAHQDSQHKPYFHWAQKEAYQCARCERPLSKNELDSNYSHLTFSDWHKCGAPAQAKPKKKAEPEERTCGFCGKPEPQVFVLSNVDAKVLICANCVAKAVRGIAKDAHRLHTELEEAKQ